MRCSPFAKIVAPVGPATVASETIRALYLSGVDAFWLNFGHGLRDEHPKVFDIPQEWFRTIG
jgi:pyruvate kinase